jgi:YjbE family integral membrane protein
MQQLSIGELAHASFWGAALEIVLVDLLLSGDNAVIIALACRGLPRRQRKWGLVIGAGLSVTLLVVFAGVLSRLMGVPYFRLVGGLVLVFIAARLLVTEQPKENEIEASAHLWRAVGTVFLADLVMSFDNILAVVQVARGDLLLLAVGLAVSIPVVIAGAALVTQLLDRVPLLIWAGSALLGWVAGQTIISDAAVADLVAGIGKSDGNLEWLAGGAGAVLVIVLGELWRRWRPANSAVASRDKSI